jgi:hypothetical protein
MRSCHRRRLVEYLCCLLVINLLVAPVTHASWILPAEGGDQGIEATQPHCQQMANAIVESHAMQLVSNEATVGQPECDHRDACKLLCSAAASMLSTDCESAVFDNSTRWLPAIVLQLNNSGLSRLDRPPRL